MELEEIKIYLRIDFAEDDKFILSLQGAAEEYLKNAGVRVGYENDLYKTAVKMLISNWYNNRDVIGGNDTLSIMFKSIVSQLVCKGSDSNES